MMWINKQGRLIQTIDQSRVEYKTRISKEMLDDLKQLAIEQDTHVGYLLENGFENLLIKNQIQFDKKNRPKDRVEFRTTCNAEILQQLRDFAKQHKLNLNDVIEAAMAHIEMPGVKKSSWRYRIE